MGKEGRIKTLRERDLSHGGLFPSLKPNQGTPTIYQAGFLSSIGLGIPFNLQILLF